MLVYGGPDGELSASMRYLSQRFSAANPRVAGLLTDIGISVMKLLIVFEKNVLYCKQYYEIK